MHRMYLSSQGLGNGKGTRKKEYLETRDNALAERDKKLDKTVKRTYIAKLLDNVQATFAGIGTYFLAKGVLNYFDVDIGPDLENGVCFGAGYAAAETVDAIDGAIRKKRVRRITKKCDKAIDSITKTYKNEVRKEYEFALKRCRKAWEESFGEKPPNGDADISWILAA